MASWRTALCAGAFSACAALAGRHLPLVAAVAVVGMAVTFTVFVERRVLTATALLLCCVLGTWRGISSAVIDTGPDSIAGHIGGGAVVVRGVVADTGVPGRDDTVVVDTRSLASAHNGTAEVAGALVAEPLTGVPVLPGDSVEVQAAALRAPGARPGALSAEALDRVGVTAVAPAARVTVLAPGGPSVARIAHQLRILLAAGVGAAVPEPESTLLLGVAFGIHGRLPGSVRTPLQDAGLIHVVAVSGLKIVVVAATVGAVARSRRWSRRRLVLVTVAVLAGYVAVSGASPAALRSSLTALAGLVLARDGRRPNSFAILGLASALLVGIEPAVAMDVGFLLSFLGTAGILLLAGPIARRLPGPRLLVEPFAVTVAAQVATAPISAGAFGALSLVGPLANALALPLLPLAMLTGGLGALLAALSPALGWLPLQLGALASRAILAVASGAAAVPFAALHPQLWPSTWVAAELGAVAAGALAWWAHDRYRPWSPRGAMAVVATAALCAGGGTLALAGALQPPVMRVTVLDVGNGVAVLVRPPHGGAILVNGGPSGPTLLTALGRVMSPLDHRLDAVVLTATDRSSSAALASLTGHYDVGVLLVSQPLPPALEAVASTLAGAGTAIAVVGAQTWSEAGVTARCLSSGPAASAPCALQLTDGTATVLVTGNLAQAAQDELAGAHPQLLAGLLVGPTTTAPSGALLAATRPLSIAVPALRSPPGLGVVGGEVLVTGRDSDLEYDAGGDGGFVSSVAGQ